MKASRYVLLLILIALPWKVYADCPNCFKDQQPLDPARDYSADGRVKVVVGIAVGSGPDSWGNPRARLSLIKGWRRPPGRG